MFSIPLFGGVLIVPSIGAFFGAMLLAALVGSGLGALRQLTSPRPGSAAGPPTLAAPMIDHDDQHVHREAA